MPTANYSWPYPAGTSSPNVPIDIKALADASDATVKTVADRVLVVENNYSRGQVFSSGNVTTNSGFFGTTEALLWSVTFTSVGNTRLYQMLINVGWSMSSGTAVFRFRWAVGGSVTTASTQLWAFKKAPEVTNGFNRLDIASPLFSGLTAGTVTVGLTAVSDGPLDGQVIAAADNIGRWDVVDFGT